MESKFVYERVLLKLSGEALKGGGDAPYDAASVNGIVQQIGGLLDGGVEMALVIGGGNIWRGAKADDVSLDRVTADQMGMLATVMNAMYLRDAFNAAGFSAEVQSATPMPSICAVFDAPSARKFLEEGKLVIFAGGTGCPYFTTDTAAALRSLEIRAQALLKATKVDGVYTDDPFKNPKAKRYETISYEQAIAEKLQVMDMTAFSLCRDNGLDIIVFNFSEPENLELVLSGDTSVATVVSRGK